MKAQFAGLLLPLLAFVQGVPLDHQSVLSTTSLPPITTAAPFLYPNNLQERNTNPKATASTPSSASSIIYYTNTCIPTIAPDKNGYVPPTECNAMYNYYPSFKAAVAFSVLFGLILITHVVQMLAYKTGFAWVIVMGMVWELGGYVVRVLSARDQQNEGLAAVTQILIFLAPLWVNAFDYMVLARMIWFFVSEKKIWPFKPSILAIIFVCLDFGAFVVQSIGGSMTTPGSDASTVQFGLHIYMGGIGIQEFFILCFLLLSTHFHHQMLRIEAQGMLSEEKRRSWRGMLYCLYFSLLAITVRIIYRLIEFASGVGLNNPITTHEWFMYAFDAFPMLLAGGVWCLCYPGKTIQGPDAKLPHSGLGRFLCCGYCHCCCCCRKDRKKKKMVLLTRTRSSEEELGPVSFSAQHYHNQESYLSTSPM